MNTQITKFNSSNIHSFTDDEGVLWFLGQDVKKALEFDNIKYDHELRSLNAYVNLINNNDYFETEPNDKNEELAKKASSQTAEYFPSILKKDVTSLGWTKEDLGLDPTARNNLTFINEAGLYLLIFKSKTPAALAFQRFVCAEILPAIRSNGYYVAPNLTVEQYESLALQLKGYEDTIKQLTPPAMAREHTLTVARKYRQRNLRLDTLAPNGKHSSLNGLSGVAFLYLKNKTRRERWELYKRWESKHTFSRFIEELAYNDPMFFRE